MTLIDIIWQRRPNNKPTPRRTSANHQTFSAYLPQHDVLMDLSYSLDQIAYITRRNRFVYVLRRSWPIMRYYPSKEVHQ